MTSSWVYIAPPSTIQTILSQTALKTTSMKFVILACVVVAVVASPARLGHSRRSFQSSRRVQPQRARQVHFSQPLPQPQQFLRQEPQQFLQPVPPPPQPLQQQFTQQERPQRRPIAILRDERVDNGDGNFRFDFETENGIVVNDVGTVGSQGQSNMQGSYSFQLPDGTLAHVNYVADEFGFRADSPLIPTPPPMPAHALEQIRIAEEQRRQGIVWD